MKQMKTRNSLLSVVVLLALVLVNVQTVFAQEEVPTGVEISGTVVSVNETEGSFVVATETGETYTVVVGEGFDYTSLQVDGFIYVEGTVNEDGSVSATSTLTEPPVDEDGTGTDGEIVPTVGYYCSQSEDQHPVGAALAEQYGTEYSAIQGWFCQGVGIGQVKLALKTNLSTGEAVETMLAAREAGSGWGQIWQQLGLIGKPDKQDGEEIQLQVESKVNLHKPDKSGKVSGPPAGKGPKK